MPFQVLSVKKEYVDLVIAMYYTVRYSPMYG